MKKSIELVSIKMLRMAAAHWRADDSHVTLWGKSNQRNASLHDRIDELIDEVERLRKYVHCRGDASGDGL